MNSWILQPGFPRISIKNEKNGINITQSTFRYDNSNDETIWKVPIEIKYELGGKIISKKMLLEKRSDEIMIDSEINLGHVIANYSLIFDQKSESQLPSGPWSECIKNVVSSTRISFPNNTIFAHLDRKSFKGWERSAIIQRLEELGVEVRRGKQISQRE